MDVPFVVSSDETPAELCDFDLVWQLGSYINAVVSMITTAPWATLVEALTLDFSSCLAFPPGPSLPRRPRRQSQSPANDRRQRVSRPEHRTTAEESTRDAYPQIT